MPAVPILADHDHPDVQTTAKILIKGSIFTHKILEKIFLFVRDEIQFGFPPTWDAVKASETIEYGRGYCVTKATLMVALCKAVGIPARIHAGLIQVAILTGVFPKFVFPFLPELGGHAWTEVQLNGKWKALDSYINDHRLYEKALTRLHRSGMKTGYSISEAQGPSCPELNFGEKGFVHMGAVQVDHGTWPDFSDYMNSDKYLPMNRVQQMTFPIIAQLANNNLKRIRQS